MASVKLDYRVGSISRVDVVSPRRLDIFYDEVPDEFCSGDPDCFFDVANDLGNFLASYFNRVYDLSEAHRCYLIESDSSPDCYVVSWNFSKRRVSIEERVSFGPVSVIDRFAEQQGFYAFMNPELRR